MIKCIPVKIFNPVIIECFTLMKLAAAQYHEYTNVTVTVLDSFDLKRIPHHDVVFKDLSNGYVFTVLTDSNGVVNLMLVRGHKFEVHSQGHLGAETEVFIMTAGSILFRQILQQ
jgi:hypothetical protein